MPESRFSRLAPGLLAPGGVLDKAECAAQRALAAGVRNGQALWRLGDIHRMQGNLDAARDLYRRDLAVLLDELQAVGLVERS